MMMMNETRFEELAAAYGATLDRWPAEERAEAEALLKTSPKAQAALEQERLLDATLNEWEAPQPSDVLMARILGDAAEVSLGQASEAAVPESTVAAEKPGLMSRLLGDWDWRPAGAMTACLAIGFVAGMSGAPAPVISDTNVASVEVESLMDIAFFDDEETDLFGLETL